MILFLLLFLLFICALLICAITIVFFFHFIAIFTTDAPFVTIPGGIDEQIFNALHLTDNSVLYDLGCGDARVLSYCLSYYPEKRPKIRAVGVDIAFIPYLLAKWKTRNIPNITLRREDIFKTDISDATHFFLYLYPKVISKLIHKIKKECRSGTRIVSCDFEIADIQPKEIIKIKSENSKRGERLFVYEI